MILSLLAFCIASHISAKAQTSCMVNIRPALVDESIVIFLNKPVYYAGDTVLVTILREDSTTTSKVTPSVTIESTMLEQCEPNTFIAVVPQNVTPGSYPIHLGVADAKGRRLVYETNCAVEVEEFQDIERIDKYVQIGPEAGSKDPLKAVTLDRKHIRNLQVVFNRDSIGTTMGPQYVTIKTTVMTRKGTITQSSERRMMTFGSHGNPNKDRAMFMRYRTAYGPFAVIHLEEIDHVRLLLDSLPSWALIKIHIEPDYAVNIGAVDISNAVTRFYRVKGPTIEMGFAIGVPKILYDTQAKDSMEYGKTSAMLRFYYVSGRTGFRFPVSLGFGAFGVNTPIDVGKGRGGFAASVFLDVIELGHRLNWNFNTKISAGLEITPFLPIQRRSRILFDAHVGYTL
jgi:hypothetical protein